MGGTTMVRKSSLAKESKKKAKRKAPKATSCKIPKVEPFTKIVVDSNMTIYSNSTSKFVHLKDNPTGLNGVTMKFTLDDGTQDLIKGPFFCTDKDIKRWTNK